MTMIQMVVFAILVVLAVHVWLTKRQNEYEASLIAEQIDKSEEMKRTLAMGLYYRFTFPTENKESGEPDFKSSTDLFLKGTPHEFEDFVAEVMETYYGGIALTTSRSSDYGIDIEHKVDGQLILGQAKVHQGDVGYEPIALIHSNMVKRGADKGFVITTSSFTKNARRYASDLNIELIDGVKLVELWLSGLEKTDQILIGDNTVSE